MKNSLKKILPNSGKPQGIFLVVCCILLCWGCENDLSKLPGNNSLKDLDNDRATDVTFIYSEKGKTKAKLYTKEFIGNEHSKPPYIDFLKGVKMDMYDDSLQVESTVTARSARYYTADKNIIARDSVVVRNRKGDKLQTEELIWNQKLERFYTDKFVRITSKDAVTWGDGMEAAQDFSWYSIKKTRGTIPVDDNSLPSE